jgi:hypothetical protein
MLYVVSTGLNAPTKARCIRTVDMQQFPKDEYRHIYVEAGEQTPPRGALENFVDAVASAKMEPMDVIISLDGDDWFPNGLALKIVSLLFANPNVWISYGSFMYGDSRPGFASAYTDEDWKDLRKADWKATHLKCYRHGLFAKLGDAEFKRADGAYRRLAWDQALMLPMLEMAGPEHSRFCEDILCVYNFANAYEFTMNAEGLAAERAESAEIRTLPKRERLVAL